MTDHVPRTPIRPAAVAGRFYPADSEALRDAVTRWMNESREAASGAVACLIAPHAGYVYSGATAGHAFARIRGTRPGRVVLLGCSHHFRFGGASIFGGAGFETPLGVAPVDTAFAAALGEYGGNGDDAPHYPEHSLEALLPFLQEALGDRPIVPVLFGEPAAPWHEAFGRHLAALLEPGDLVVCSTDLSHFLTEDAAHRIDRRSLDAVLAQDPARYREAIAAGDCAMCGAAAVTAAMAAALARGADDWRLLDYRTSAAASGDRSRVVGYGAVSMERRN